MKKIVFALALLFSVAGITLTGCSTSDDPVPTKDQLILGKWTIKSAISHSGYLGVIKKDTTNYTTSDYMDFKADGTVAIRQTNVNYNGKWKITNDKIYFTETNYLDDTKGFELPVLTSSALEFYQKSSLQNGDITLELFLKLSK